MGLDARRSRVLGLAAGLGRVPGNARLFRLALLAALIAVVVVATAAAIPPACTGGISSVGPAVLVHGHLDRGKSDLEPHRRACVPHLRS